MSSERFTLDPRDGNFLFLLFFFFFLDFELYKFFIDYRIHPLSDILQISSPILKIAFYCCLVDKRMHMPSNHNMKHKGRSDIIEVYRKKCEFRCRREVFWVFCLKGQGRLDERFAIKQSLAVGSE